MTPLGFCFVVFNHDSTCSNHRAAIPLCSDCTVGEVGTPGVPGLAWPLGMAGFGRLEVGRVAEILHLVHIYRQQGCLLYLSFIPKSTLGPAPCPCSSETASSSAPMVLDWTVTEIPGASTHPTLPSLELAYAACTNVEGA